MLKSLFISAVACIALEAVVSVKADPLEAYRTSRITKRIDSKFLEYLNPVLRSGGLVGRIYYQTICKSNSDDPVPFPDINVGPPLKDQNGIDAIREILKHNDNVKIVSDDSGIIRIFLPSYRDSVLDINIPLVKFSQFDQYNAPLAMGKIWQDDQVKFALENLGKKPFAMPIDMLFPPPNEQLPHLPPSIRDVSIDHALDVIAKTFDAVIFYGSCTSGGIFISYSYPISGN